MIALFPALLLVSGAIAAILPRGGAPCAFTMTAIFPANLTNEDGTVKEDTIGENRIGGSFQQGNYILNGTSLTDYQGHNCLIYSSSAQFLCSLGSLGTQNFTLSGNGKLLQNGCIQWWACPASGPDDDGSFNIFSKDKKDTTGCLPVNLQTSESCTPVDTSNTSTSTISTVATSTTASTTLVSSIVPTSTAPASSCPTDLSGSEYQSPHLIVPTSSNASNHSFGNLQTAYISATNSTLFNFDVPNTAPYTGNCTLIFFFPYRDQADPAARNYIFSGIEEEVDGNGGIDFALLGGVANVGTTHATTPAVATDYGSTQVIPGDNYTIAEFHCSHGATVTYSANSVGGVELDYFQDSGSDPIGLYLLPCA